VGSDGSGVGAGVVDPVQAEADELEHPVGALGVPVAERPGFHELPDLGEGLVEGAGRVMVREGTAPFRLVGDRLVVLGDPGLHADAGDAVLERLPAGRAAEGVVEQTHGGVPVAGEPVGRHRPDGTGSEVVLAELHERLRPHSCDRPVDGGVVVADDHPRLAGQRTQEALPVTEALLW